MVKWLIVLLSLLASPAWAADEEAARAAFDEGRRQFAAGNYDAALPRLESAYRLSNKRPSTTLALAQCHRALGNVDRAIQFFREYLAAAPAATDRASIEKTIEVLEKERPPSLDPAVPPPPAPPDPFEHNVRRDARPEVTTSTTVLASPEPRSEDSNTWWWVLGGVVLLGAAAAAVAVATSGSPDPVGGSLGRTIRL